MVYEFYIYKYLLLNIRWLQRHYSKKLYGNALIAIQNLGPVFAVYEKCKANKLYINTHFL